MLNPLFMFNVQYSKTLYCRLLAVWLFTLCAYMLFAQKGNSAKVYEVNLVKNAGAETEGADHETANWNPSPATDDWGFMHDSYGHVSGEWDWNCNEKCGLPPHAGAHYFRLPASNESPMYALSQKIDLSMIADSLQKRTIRFILSGYIAGFKCDQANCGKGILSIIFSDKGGKELNTYEISKDNNDMKQANGDDERMRLFEAISVSNEVPANASYAVITIKADSKACCNSAYIFFDNLQFMLSPGSERK